MQINSFKPANQWPPTVAAKQQTDKELGSILERLDSFTATGSFGPGAKRGDTSTDQENQFIELSNIVLSGGCLDDENPKLDKAMGQPGLFENHRCAVRFEGHKEVPDSLHGVIFDGGATYVASQWDPKHRSVYTHLAVAQQAEGSNQAILVGFGRNQETGKTYVERLTL